MLKITPQTTEHSTRLVLEGRLAGPWVEELERVWREGKESSTNSLVVDLTGVTYIEQAGKGLLSRMWLHGAELLVAGCCSRSVLEDIMSAGRSAPSNRIAKNSSNQ
ncbi:MAG: hypothetical protein LZF86_120035 [Nitrospira sp.]|nr:MAG: hypothetical protein LZF86_120035 [Nitrospira sp.]